MKEQADEIRTVVADYYTRSVVTSVEGGCCKSEPATTNALVGLAGYSPEQLGTLPVDAVVNSIGCGDPVALAELAPGDVVLDLGSGAGIDLFLAAMKVGSTGRVIGVDMTDEMITRANANIAAGGYTNVEVRRGIIEELPVEDESVDWVISNCVINLSPEKHRVFGEIARVLKPGGRMLVSDLVAHDLPEELRSHPDLYSFCVAGAISEEEYLTGLQTAGLKDAEVRHRLIYDADQLLALAAPTFDETSCLTDGLAALQAHARMLAGKVWSAKVYARKPA